MQKKAKADTIFDDALAKTMAIFLILRRILIRLCSGVLPEPESYHENPMRIHYQKTPKQKPMLLLKTL